MNFEAFSIERERDARLLSEAIGKRALARQDWGASLGLSHYHYSRKELAELYDEYSEASRRREEAFKEVWRLTDMIEKRALETGQV